LEAYRVVRFLFGPEECAVVENDRTKQAKIQTKSPMERHIAFAAGYFSRGITVLGD
jgi:hypothetical protein